jgi:hypothetical protein
MRVAAPAAVARRRRIAGPQAPSGCRQVAFVNANRDVGLPSPLMVPIARRCGVPVQRRLTVCAPPGARGVTILADQSAFDAGHAGTSDADLALRILRYAPFCPVNHLKRVNEVRAFDGSKLATGSARICSMLIDG